MLRDKREATSASLRKKEHHVTIPNHDPLRIGTLAGILADIAEHLEFTRDELIEIIFER